MEELKKIKKKNIISRLPCRLLNPERIERSRIDIQLAPNFGHMVEMKCAKLRFCAEFPNYDEFDFSYMKLDISGAGCGEWLRLHWDT
jgi:hypothetical protein